MDPTDRQEADVLDRATRALRETPVPEDLDAGEMDRLLAACLTAVRELTLGDDFRIPQDSSQPVTRRDAHVPTELADGVSRETHVIKQPPGRRHVARRFVAMFQSKKIRWSVVAAAAAVALVVLGLWPQGSGRGSGNGAAWADVFRQMQMAQTAHLRITTREKHIAGGKKVVLDVHMKAPDKVRSVWPAAVAGKEAVAIMNGPRLLTLYPSEKKCVLATADPLSVEKIFAQYCLFPDAATAPEREKRPALLGSGSGRLVFHEVQERNGRRLKRYLLEMTDKPAQPDAVENGRTYYWLDPTSHEVALITFERAVDGKSVETSSVEVQLNVPLSEDLFSTEVPVGYTAATQASKPKDSVSLSASGKLRDLSAKYEKARAAIQHYRLIVWSGECPNVRAVCDGKRLRIERFNNRPVKPDPDFDAAWKQAGSAPMETYLLYAGRLARICRWPAETKVQWDATQPSDTCLLSGIGWPTWPSHPYDYQWLPSRPDQSGLIGIRAVSNFVGEESEGLQTLVIYWIDPARDYLCVREEEHVRKGQPWKDNLEWQPTEPEVLVDRPKQIEITERDSVRDITEFSRTPEGRWYPKVIQKHDAQVVEGKRYIMPGDSQRYELQLDTTGRLDDSLFAWPADVPKPQ